jgi:hypothetical protein
VSCTAHALTVLEKENNTGIKLTEKEAEESTNDTSDIDNLGLQVTCTTLTYLRTIRIQLRRKDPPMTPMT